jgi:hypothetical protein
MDIVPKTVVVAVPVNIPELRGRHATTPPHGVVTTIRMPKETLQEVDLAISHVDPAMSRGLYIRLVALNVARAINEYYAELRRRTLEIEDGPRTSIGPGHITTTSKDDVG